MQPIKRNYYYQPAFLGSIASWTWTLLILVMGVIFWLEVTHFNWITAGFFVAFIVVVLVQYLTRTLEVQDGNLIINRTLQKTWLVMNIANIQSLRITKFGIQFIYNANSHFFYLTKKDRSQLFQLLKKNHAQIVEE
ncbi:EbsA family protein [Pediococcus siamensis]|uniref:EbsA family protein n=1 Tax=Pediococcus siamensis TaxID=381829 RepID=UPI0039A2CC5B